MPLILATDEAVQTIDISQPISEMYHRMRYKPVNKIIQ